MTYESYPEFCLARWKLLPTEEGNLLHIAIGFTGEILELREATSRENLLEELADAAFYLTVGQQFFPNPDNFNPEPWPKTKEEQFSRLLSLANELLDYSKKCFIYEQHIPKFIIGEILTIACVCLEGYANFFGFDMADLTDHSRAKLLKRYPEGYSNQAAFNRADKEGSAQ